MWRRDRPFQDLFPSNIYNDESPRVALMREDASQRIAT